MNLLSIRQKVSNYFISVVIISMISACQKDNNDEVLDESINLKSNYDYVGEFHNQALEFCIQDLANTKTTKNSCSNDKKMVESLTKFYAQSSENSNLLLSNKEINISMLDNDFFQNYEKNMLRSRSLKSSKVKDNLNSVQLEYYNKIFVLLDYFANPRDMQRFYFEMMLLERNINFSHLTKEEREPLLITCSIARSSGEFWSRRVQFLYNSMDHYGRTKRGMDSPFWKKWTSVMKMTMEYDIEGGMVGAVTGAIYGGVGGTVVGPAGTVTGAISGAVIGGAQGAVMGSAFGAIKGILTKYNVVIEEFKPMLTEEELNLMKRGMENLDPLEITANMEQFRMYVLMEKRKPTKPIKQF